MQRLLFRLAILVTSVGASVLCAQTSTFVIVNAASYAAAPAPDSLATIFGTGLAQATATAILGADGQLPIELASIQVEIGGVAARLFYASPTQINLVVPGGIDPGSVDVVIRPTGSGTSKTATASLRTAAPGVFTSDASGAGQGAILNAVTYTPAPFIVQTPNNGSDKGGDTRTRLAVYGTGFRHAKLVTATAQDAAGNRYTLKVEYADAAPGFIGLDQVNLLLPPDLDGAGAVSLLLGADGIPANPVTFQMNLLAASALQLTSLTVSPAFLSAGDGATVTVGLNGVARAGGFFVALRSSNAAAQVPAQVTIPEGKSSAQAALTTVTVPAPVNPTITAQAGGVTRTASLEIDPASAVQLANVSVSPTSILGGRNLMGTVRLTGNAPAGGVKVPIASDSDSVLAPNNGVAVPFGSSSADFAIATLAVNEPKSVTLTATFSRTTAIAKLTLLPPMQLTLDTSSVTGGNSVTGTVTLGDPAPIAGATIQIQSGDGTVARLPGSVIIASGQTSQTFTVTTFPVTSSRVLNITATYGGLKQTASLTVNPQAAPTLSTLTIAPNPVTGGNDAQGTVTLTAPATVATEVTLFSNNAIIASVSPGLVTVPLGRTSATFPIKTTRGPVAINVTITASMPGVSESAILTVQ